MPNAALVVSHPREGALERETEELHDRCPEPVGIGGRALQQRVVVGQPVVDQEPAGHRARPHGVIGLPGASRHDQNTTG